MFPKIELKGCCGIW